MFKKGEIMNLSPYAAELGARRRDLHPTLARYFDTIPDGRIGFGTGVFDVVGTPRRWLHPLLIPLHRAGVIPAGWWTDVPFTVINRTDGDTADGKRIFHLPGGDWTMTDRVSRTPRGLHDEVGEPATVVASLALSTRNGTLLLRNTRAGIRIGRIRITAPRWFTPRLRITESITVDDRQHVAMTLDVPVIGRIYEYRGSFTYEVREES